MSKMLETGLENEFVAEKKLVQNENTDWLSVCQNQVRLADDYSSCFTGENQIRRLCCFMLMEKVTVFKLRL